MCHRSLDGCVLVRAHAPACAGLPVVLPLRGRPEVALGAWPCRAHSVWGFVLLQCGDKSSEIIPTQPGRASSGKWVWGKAALLDLFCCRGAEGGGDACPGCAGGCLQSWAPLWSLPTGTEELGTGLGCGKGSACSPCPSGDGKGQFWAMVMPHHRSLLPPG